MARPGKSRLRIRGRFLQFADDGRQISPMVDQKGLAEWCSETEGWCFAPEPVVSGEGTSSLGVTTGEKAGTSATMGPG